MSTDHAVTAFEVAIPQARLDRIYQQLELARTSAAGPNDESSGSHGMTVAWIESLRRYWIDQYDWRAAQAQLNLFPHYLTEVDGHALHFYHVPGRGPDPTPVLLLHGWPYSNFSFVPFLERLTDPARFGGDPADALTVVAPANPGTAFSPAGDTLLGPDQIAELYHCLMTQRLGYRRFGLQGGDFGAGIAPALALAHPDSVLGMHLNLVPAIPAPVDQHTPEEQAWNTTVAEYVGAEMDYFQAQMNKPLMVGASLAASPLATAIWIAEKFWSWTDHQGDLDRVISKDRLLTEIMAYVVTESIESSIWQYRTLRSTPVYPARPVATATGVFLADHEMPIGNPPRPAIERTYHLVHETRHPTGMHFPFLETPDAFSADIRAFFAHVTATAHPAVES